MEKVDGFHKGFVIRQRESSICGFFLRESDSSFTCEEDEMREFINNGTDPLFKTDDKFQVDENLLNVFDGEKHEIKSIKKDKRMFSNFNKMKMCDDMMRVYKDGNLFVFFSFGFAILKDRSINHFSFGALDFFKDCEEVSFRTKVDGDRILHMFSSNDRFFIKEVNKNSYQVAKKAVSVILDQEFSEMKSQPDHLESIIKKLGKKSTIKESPLAYSLESDSFAYYLRR